MENKETRNAEAVEGAGDDKDDGGMAFGDEEEKKEPVSAGKSTNKQERDPDIKPDEYAYERIRIMLGAGQHGDQPRLSDIFYKDDQLNNQAELGSKDPYNAMRYLNQEINDEIENKNSMLKDMMVDQHNDVAQKALQIQFDTEKFFNLQREILNGGSPPE